MSHVSVHCPMPTQQNSKSDWSGFLSAFAAKQAIADVHPSPAPVTYWAKIGSLWLTGAVGSDRRQYWRVTARSATLFFRSGPLSGVVYPGLFGLGMAGQGAQGSRIRAVTHTWPLLTRSAIYGPECEHKHGAKSRLLEITNGTLNLGIITRRPLALVWRHPALFRLRHRQR